MNDLDQKNKSNEFILEVADDCNDSELFNVKGINVECKKIIK